MSTPGGSGRDAFLLAHATTTRADVVFALRMAATEAELDEAAHLSLVLFGVAGCASPFTEHDRSWPSLHAAVLEARERLGTEHHRAAEVAADRTAAAGQAQARARRLRGEELHADRERHITAVGGIQNVAPRRRTQPTEESP